MMIDRERVIPNILANNIRPQPPAPRAKNTSKENIYMCGKILGRVGNAFFNYASIVGIARANNMTLYLKDESVLADVLQNPPTATSAREFDEKCSTALFLPQPKCCAFYPQFMQLPKDDHYMVITCLISWRYFENIKAEIKSLLQFRTDVQTEAQRIVGKVRSQTKNVTVVGMHIRRGDQSGWIAYLHGHNPVTPEYVSRAMTYFLQRFPHVHFLVASEDTAWCQQYVGQGSENVTIMEGNSAAVDIAVLTLTDHMIVSIGTFGWWAGYLNPGIKTYMKGFIGADSDFSGNFDDLNATDYVYPDWIPL
ncbi:galactoside alpha-(1,2)-fucosyltransferase 1-like [Littorina saxatilis]|uniref:galactoside alpha-(1,2)-fucosyltransferase 1-like n=1 Tax=Littorina saxatilis TaxID=31220 RepID=UPI0038B5C954